MKKTLIVGSWRGVAYVARLFFLSSALLMAGCNTDNARGVSEFKSGTVISEPKRMDYLSVECVTLWQIKGQQAENNVFYWLRAMDCAEQMAPVDARALAHDWDENTWQAAFRQSILLSKAKITPQERRIYITKLDRLGYAIPGQVRSLFQLWRDNEKHELALAQARGRYSLLQESSDRQLDELRQQEKVLRSQLAQTTQQLQNLTDIERRLSSRKSSSGYAPAEGKNDSGNEHDELTTSGENKTQNVAQPQELKP